MTDKFKSLSKAKKILLGVGAFTILASFAGASNTQQPPSTPVSGSSGQVKAAETHKVTTDNIQEVSTIPFTSTTENDPSLESGKRTTAVAGVNGEKVTTFKVTYTDGIETSRVQIGEYISKQPVNELIKVGTKVAAPRITSCSSGYINVDGNCVHSPSNDPTGASAQCNDGTYSYSQHRQGTCSHHGGVARWL